MLKALLNKGGAGKSIDRAETAARLGRLMRHHQTIMHAYDRATRSAASPQFAAGLELLNKTTRADIGKISELILSSGHAPPLGTEFETVDFGAEPDDSVHARALLDLDRRYVEMLESELDARHMLRTVATIENTLANTRMRIDTIRRMGEKLRLGVR